jgi:hypothetical protein
MSNSMSVNNPGAGSISGRADQFNSALSDDGQSNAPSQPPNNQTKLENFLMQKSALESLADEGNAVPEQSTPVEATAQEESGSGNVQFGKASVGIGIEANNPDAYRNGTHHILKDPGHTFMYVKDETGGTVCVYSVGPIDGIGKDNLNRFKTAGVPGFTSYPIEENSNTWEWPLQDATQLEICKSICTNLKDNTVTYSPTTQCTSEAIRLAKACGAPVPDGVSPVTVDIPIIGETKNYPNPYHLNNQLSELPYPSAVKVPPGTYVP